MADRASAHVRWMQESRTRYCLPLCVGALAVFADSLIALGRPLPRLVDAHLRASLSCLTDAVARDVQSMRSLGFSLGDLDSPATLPDWNCACQSPECRSWVGFIYQRSEHTAADWHKCAPCGVRALMVQRGPRADRVVDAAEDLGFRSLLMPPRRWVDLTRRIAAHLGVRRLLDLALPS